MEKNIEDKQWVNLNHFLYMTLGSIIIISIFKGLNAWFGNIAGLIVVFIFLYWACKNLKISVKELILPQRKNNVTALDGFVLTLFLFSAAILVDYLNVFLFYIVLKAPVISGMRNFPALLYLFIVGPIVEETIFRVVGLQVCEKAGGKTFAVIVTSVFFGVLHSGMKASSAFVLGMAMALVVYLTGNALYSYMFHIIANTHAFVFSFIFSELGLNDRQMILLLSFIMILIIILSFVYLRNRPVFQCLLKWGNFKRTIKSIKDNKPYYVRLVCSPVILLSVILLGVFSFMAFMAQLG